MNMKIATYIKSANAFDDARYGEIGREVWHNRYVPVDKGGPMPPVQDRTVSVEMLPSTRRLGEFAMAAWMELSHSEKRIVCTMRTQQPAGE